MTFLEGTIYRIYVRCIADWIIIFVAAGLEEISTRLNLMVKAELAELVAGAPMNPGDPETRCQYLEKLLGKHGQNFKALSFVAINPRDDDHLTLPPANVGHRFF